MMEAIIFLETSVLTWATRRDIPEDTILHSHRRENLKSNIPFYLWSIHIPDLFIFFLLCYFLLHVDLVAACVTTRRNVPWLDPANAAATISAASNAKQRLRETVYPRINLVDLNKLQCQSYQPEYQRCIIVWKVQLQNQILASLIMKFWRQTRNNHVIAE
jgi:hypothetical protein